MGIDTSEAFDNNPWIENNGIKPCIVGWIDTKWRRGCVEMRHEVDAYHWRRSGGDYDITHWRLHKPDEAPERHVSKLPEVTQCPPMPPCKPSKREDSKVCQAFNRMTGHSLTEADLGTLKVLLDVFGE